MTAYYNEFDKQAAAWLRELMEENLIAPGVVDERSIEDVTPGDLAGFTQCHFFAGIGGWPAALRLAGVPDSEPVWTGSAPCQPFSAAGESAGFADERHLWPSLKHLIRVRRPRRVFGEQVASKAADVWIDLVHTDMEAMDYAFAAIAFPSAGVGAPHIRDRTYWVGDADFAGLEGLGSRHQAALGHGQGAVRPAAEASEPRWLADPYGGRRAEGRPWAKRSVPDAGGAPGGLADANGLRQQPQAVGELHDAEHHAEPCGSAVGLADAARGGLAEGCGPDGGHVARYGSADHGLVGAGGRPGPTNGFWRDADWLACRDGKWRPVEPGTFPLAHGISGRVGLLRGAGNAVNVEAAKAFIEAYYGSC